jgi:glutamyl-tRNA reductase
MNLFCVGLSHHESKVETLERFGGHAETRSLLRRTGCSELLLLNTCNRVEVYAVAASPPSTIDVARCLGEIGNHETPGSFYRYEAHDCVTHLFRVASGLDSMVLGETEILGQIKKAYEAARSGGEAGPLLHRVFQRAFRVAKQVRTHTEITRGPVSVSSVAVELASKVFGDLSARKVLILGAGEVSERTARTLKSRGVSDLRVANRSFERAHELAQAVAGRAERFEDWKQQCADVDILISSTSAGEPLLDAASLAPLLRSRLDRPLFIIDMAVPRDIAPDVNQLDGVFLYDIDSLQSVAAQSLNLRRRQIAAAEAIIAQHVDDLWQSRLRRNGDPAQPAAITPISVSDLRASQS